MNILNKKAFSVVEYVVLFVIIIGAFLIMRNYIQRGIYGMWGQTGQSLAFGRQYDPQKTIECSFDEQSNFWYDRNWYESAAHNCSDAACQEAAMSSTCQTNTCGQLNH